MSRSEAEAEAEADVVVVWVSRIHAAGQAAGSLSLIRGRFGRWRVFDRERLPIVKRSRGEGPIKEQSWLDRNLVSAYSRTTAHRVGAEPTRWFALALLCAVQFMVVLDVAIVNVALPSIQLVLGFSRENLQWVVSAYALVFGGFDAAAGVLLGGILTDLLSWEWIFFVNVPVGVVGLALAPVLFAGELGCSRAEP
jgi:hypothetical protein